MAQAAAVVDHPAVDGEEAFEQAALGDAREQAVGDRVAVEGAGHVAGAVERLEEQAPLEGAEVGPLVEEGLELGGGAHAGTAQGAAVERDDRRS